MRGFLVPGFPGTIPLDKPPWQDSIHLSKKPLDRIEMAWRFGATTLNLSDLGLTNLPESLAQLQNLQTLNVSGNQLTALPDSLAQLQNLQVMKGLPGLSPASPVRR